MQESMREREREREREKEKEKERERERERERLEGVISGKENKEEAQNHRWTRVTARKIIINSNVCKCCFENISEVNCFWSVCMCLRRVCVYTACVFGPHTKCFTSVCLSVGVCGVMSRQRCFLC